LNIIFRLLGLVAQTSNSLSRQSVNLVPMNWFVIIVTGGIAVMGWAIVFGDGNPMGLLGALPFTFIAGAYIASFVKRDTFFIRESLPAPVPISGDAPLATDLRWTGRLRLHEKAAKRFLDMPATATRLEDGSFTVVSNIDASTRFYGVVTNSKVGLWLALPRPASFEIEAGSLYYGFRGAAALRLSFIDGADEKKAKAILSFDSPEARNGFYSWLEAEKARVGSPAISSNSPQASSASPFSSSTSSA
jgi:hypothetical protein